MQAMALRRHYLPHDEDDPLALAQALWLAEYFHKSRTHATAAGIGMAFNGKG